MSEIQTQPLDAVDFSGGITDNYLGGVPNQAQALDNLHVVQFGGMGKLVSREGSEAYFDRFAFNSTDLVYERVNALRAFKNNIFAFAIDKVYTPYNNGVGGLLTAFTELTGPTGESAFDSSIVNENIPVFTEWNDHLLFCCDSLQTRPQKIIWNQQTHEYTLLTAGLPVYPGGGTFTPTAGANSYLYKLLFYYTYEAGQEVTYEDFGTPVQFSVTNAAAPNLSQIAITGIDELVNVSGFNYDTANIKIKIYRTTNAGTTFYYVGQVNNGTTTYNDTMSDANLILQPTLYTEGGVVENDPPPKARAIHVIGDVCYYAGLREWAGAEYHLNQVRHSIPGDIDSVPTTFSVDVQDEIIGFSSHKNIPIAVCKTSAYRIDGQYDLLGRGGMIATKISDTTSCTHQQSLVQTQSGLFWCGIDGFYWSDGYQVIRINEHLLQSHRQIVGTVDQQRRIQGKYDHTNRRVYWTIQSTAGGDCDKIIVLHLDFGISKNSCFTTLSGGDGELAENFAPTAIEFFTDTEGDELDTTTFYRGDSRGYVLRHATDLLSDPVIDFDVAYTSWNTQPIIYNYTSVALNMGSSFVRKFVTRVIASFKHESNLSVQITSINDDGRMIEDLEPIRYRDNLIWGDDTTIFGTDSLIWGYDGMVDEMRRMPAQSIRCDYKQLKFTNAHVNIVNSDDYATVDSMYYPFILTRKIVQLTDLAIAWPSDLETYVIAFEEDDYTKEYEILERVNDYQIVILDALDTKISASGEKWVIRGRPKDEKFHLIGFTLHYSLLGKTHRFFRRSDKGEVAS